MTSTVKTAPAATPSPSGPRKTRRRKIIGGTLYGLLLSALIFVIAWMLIGGLFVYGNKAYDRENALQNKYPQVNIYLSDYLKAAGLPYQETVPVTIGAPIAASSVDVHGGGFTILGTGGTSVSSTSKVGLYYQVKANLGGTYYLFLASADMVTLSDSATTAVLHLPNVVMNTYQPIATCSNGIINISRITCKVDPDLSDRLYSDTLAGIKSGGMDGVLTKYGTGITAPTSSVP